MEFMSKIRVNLTIDESVWFGLGLKCNGSKSQLIEDLARAYLYNSTSLEELRDEIANDELELRAKKKQLKFLKEQQELNDMDLKLNQKAMNTVRKLLGNQGKVIGENQITNIARINGLTPSKLIKEVKKIENITVDKFYEPPKN